AAPDRYAMFEAVARVLAAAGRDHPILLVLEDLQWADKDTLLLLRHVLDSPLPARLAGIGSYPPLWIGGDHPLPATPAPPPRRHELIRMTPSGLGAEDTGRLAAQRLGHEPPAELTQALLERTNGNPLFIVELLRDAPEA